jgi:hypothetical protein
MNVIVVLRQVRPIEHERGCGKGPASTTLFAALEGVGWRLEGDEARGVDEGTRPRASTTTRCGGDALMAPSRSARAEEERPAIWTATQA